jgi:ketosteroid isomerase-like protein
MYAIKSALFLSFSLCLLAACAPKVADTTADVAALHAGTDAWVAAYTAGEVDKIVALYAEDAVMMPPDAPAAVGQAAMRAFLAADSAASKAAGVTLVLGDSASGVSGDLGWHSGTFKIANAAGETVGTGKYSEVWHKANGKWLMIRDIWNNDAAAAAPAAAPPAAAAPAVPAK